MAVDYDTPQGKLLRAMELLLDVEAMDVKTAVEHSSDALVEALGADKIDIAFLDPSTNTLIALGVSNTPMGELQIRLGMNRLPIANGGRLVEVFETGESYLTGRADEDPGVLRGFTEGMGIRSMMGVPLDVGGERRGVLHAASERPEAFDEGDLRFLQAVSRWVGLLTHRAELAERVAYAERNFPRQSASEVLERFETPSPELGLFEGLTRREREILELMTQGVTTDRDLSERLTISPNTVKYHISNIMGKLQAQSRQEAAVRARELGLL